MGDSAKVASILKPALIAAIDNRGLPWRSRFEALLSLAELEERDGSYEMAENLARKACSLTEQLPGISQTAIVWAFRRFARIQLALGKVDATLTLADKIQEAEERQLAEIFSFTSERQRLAYLKSFSRERYSLWATAGAVRPLTRAVLRTKGLVIDSLLEDRLLAFQADDPKVRDLIRRLQLARQRVVGLNAGLTATTIDSNRLEHWTKELAMASREVESAEAVLARQMSGLGRGRRALRVTVEEVQRAIPEHAAVLEIVPYSHYQGKWQWRDSYGVLALVHQGEPRWVFLGAAEAIDRNVKLYQHSVRDASDNGALASALKELYAQLWQPILEVLPPTTTSVIISPDALLNFVSFATLLKPDGSFLGEEMPIRYVSTARDLLDDSRPDKGPATLAAWANPDFRGTALPTAGHPVAFAACRAAAVRELRDLRLEALPGAEAEGRRLCEKASELGFTQATLHLGPDATESALRQARSPRLLHLATHGFVLPDVPEASAPASIDPDSLFPHAVRLANNPMLRSGLALAGAQRTIEAWARGEAVPADNDGIVTAEEIAALDLKNTWLVVLSACDTGLGEARSGEGVLGLRRGFIQAGAKNLLMTLWPIDDERTADLIADFYEADKKYGNAAKALAVTQRKWLASLRAEKGVAEACRVAGPFILSFKGSPAPGKRPL